MNPFHRSHARKSKSRRADAEPSAWHISSIAFRHIDLVRVQVTRKAFEIGSTWNPVTLSPLARTAAIAALSPSGWPTMSWRQHDLRESRAFTGAASPRAAPRA